MTSVVLVANAGAGSAKSDSVAAARSTLAEQVDVDFRETAHLDELDALAQELDGRTLVVAGGDGSLHAAVNALHRAGALERSAVGLIPLGTGNDLARSAGLPFDPIAAACVVLTCQPQPHDLLEGPGSVVAVNAVHLGVGAEAVRAGASFKRWLGPAGYPLGAVIAGLRHPGWRLQVSVDGRAVDVDRRVLMVGMSVGRSIGGGTPLAPDAKVADGLIDVTVAATAGPLARLKFARRLRDGRHRELSDVASLRAKTISVQGDLVRANVDGEVGEPRSAWTWTSRPQAWRLIRPADPH